MENEREDGVPASRSSARSKSTLRADELLLCAWGKGRKSLDQNSDAETEAGGFTVARHYLLGNSEVGARSAHNQAPG